MIQNFPDESLQYEHPVMPLPMTVEYEAKDQLVNFLGRNLRFRTVPCQALEYLPTPLDLEVAANGPFVLYIGVPPSSENQFEVHQHCFHPWAACSRPLTIRAPTCLDTSVYLLHKCQTHLPLVEVTTVTIQRSCFPIPLNHLRHFAHLQFQWNRRYSKFPLRSLM